MRTGGGRAYPATTNQAASPRLASKGADMTHVNGRDSLERWLWLSLAGSIVVSGAGGPTYVEVSALPRLRPSLDLARLRRDRTATITVRAMNTDARLGPPGRAVYAQQPTRRKG
jgi:hypothetical protein